VVDGGPASLNGQGTFDVPFASVTICQPGTSTCATIDHMLVDTGSTGVRIFASVLAAAGLNPTITADPSVPQNTMAECLAFVDGYVWGPMATVTLQAAGETASNLPIQIISDTTAFTPSVPAACTNVTIKTSLNTVADFGANGVLGVGNFPQDCGGSCADCSASGTVNPCTQNGAGYYSCDATTNSCAPVPVARTQQVQQPVTLFASDNNGVILTLPAVPAAGQATAQGTLTFGIGTQSNNALGAAKVITLDEDGFFTSTFNNTALASSFIDSGSNAYFFNDSSLTTCTGGGDASDFYCPSSTQTLMVVNQGHSANGTATGSANTVTFQIANLNMLSGYALNDVGGIGATSTGTNPLSGDFDFGLPFFFGRSVYTGVESSVTAPYYAY
jgi:hypothetical protein